MGVLLTETEVFPTYNLGDSMIEWDYKAEMRFKAMMQTTICQKRLNHQYSGDSISGLLLGNSMELAAEIFRQTREKEYFFLMADMSTFIISQMTAKVNGFFRFCVIPIYGRFFMIC